MMSERSQFEQAPQEEHVVPKADFSFESTEEADTASVESQQKTGREWTREKGIPFIHTNFKEHDSGYDKYQEIRMLWDEEWKSILNTEDLPPDKAVSSLDFEIRPDASIEEIRTALHDFYQRTFIQLRLRSRDMDHENVSWIFWRMGEVRDQVCDQLKSDPVKKEFWQEVDFLGHDAEFRYNDYTSFIRSHNRRQNLLSPAEPPSGAARGTLVSPAHDQQPSSENLMRPMEGEAEKSSDTD